MEKAPKTYILLCKMNKVSRTFLKRETLSCCIHIPWSLVFSELQSVSSELTAVNQTNASGF